MSPIEIINYWYSEPMNKHWFSSTPELDNEIKNNYEQIWIKAANGELDDWKNTANGCLALAIILDQFPLNMFRGQAKSFRTEAKAIEVTLHAIQNDFDKKIDIEKLAFLIMPLMHSENIEHQNLSVKLFTQHKLKSNLRFACHHNDIVKRFGRFPHRNKILERESTPEETAYLESSDAFKG